MACLSHSRHGEQIQCSNCFLKALADTATFGAPAKDSMAYLRTEQQSSIPENDICTGRSVHFSQTENAHVSCCQNRLGEAFLLSVILAVDH